MSGDIMQTWVFFLFLNGENGSHFGMMHFTCCLYCVHETYVESVRCWQVSCCHKGGSGLISQETL